MRTSYNHLTTTVFDELNHKTEQENDGLGRMIASRSYTGDGTGQPAHTLYASASYDYDIMNRLDKVTGPDGAVIDPSYNLLGWKTSLSDPSMGTWSYDHDDVGNMTYQVDARGCGTTLSYDALNRPKGRVLSGPVTCGAMVGAAFTYDQVGVNQFGKGRRTGLTDGSGSTLLYYDERGRVHKETKSISGWYYETEWTHDAADRVKTLTHPDGEVVTYEYNAQGLADSLSSSIFGDIVSSSTHNAANQPTARNLETDSAVPYSQVYDYDPNTLRLTTLKAGNNGIPADNLINMSYQYDAVGNVLSITDAAAFGGSQTQNFKESDGTPAYDELNRLKRAEAVGGSNGAYAPVTYSYDPNGNIATFKGKSYGYDASSPHRITTIDGVQQYWYDANGNVTRRIVPGLDLTLSYDAENRLTTVTNTVTSADIVSYLYDGDGVRVQEVQPTLTRVFVGDHYEISGESIRKYYSIGGMRVAENLDGALYFLLSDHLGSTALTTDREGGRFAELRYYPYGDNRYNTGGQITTYRYTGQRWGSGTGLYWYRSRWYDPYLNRWIQPDTVIPDPGDPQSLNRYSYAANNPLKDTDPSGHRPIPESGGAGGGGVLLWWAYKAAELVNRYGPRVPFLIRSLPDQRT